MITDPVLDILVVEDEMSSVLLTQKIKEEFKQDVKIHKNGKGLLKDLGLYKDLDVIIVDQQYTNENLVDTLKAVKRKSPGTEVIVLSSNTDTKMVDSVKHAGAYDYIYKDRSAVDKIVYSLKAFITRKKLHAENVKLRSSSKRSRTALMVMILMIAGIIGFFVYYLTK
ncbi:MAG: response regulator [Cytophagaceae bacterium]|nr:response regulator [Cytophagaceae bacterium]